MKLYYTYVLTNQFKNVLYIGVTNDLVRRLQEHIKESQTFKKTFTGKYNCIHLIYYEQFRQPREAIAREKELKGWTREKKLNLIKAMNPELKFITIL